MKCTLKKKQLFFVRKIVLSFLILSCFSLSFRANVPVKNWLHGNVCEGQLFVTQENVQRSCMKHGIIFERVVMSEEIRAS